MKARNGIDDVQMYTSKQKTGSCNSRFFMCWPCLQVSVQPLADIVRYYACCNRYEEWDDNIFQMYTSFLPERVTAYILCCKNKNQSIIKNNLLHQSGRLFFTCYIIFKLFIFYRLRAAAINRYCWMRWQALTAAVLRHQPSGACCTSIRPASGRA